ncbi:hypothetical protein KM043_001884 [Ampulex compressa]|nr:hypothetical protein KM043_001884 [Ampulex compressa]
MRHVFDSRRNVQKSTISDVYVPALKHFAQQDTTLAECYAQLTRSCGVRIFLHKTYVYRFESRSSSNEKLFTLSNAGKIKVILAITGDRHVTRRVQKSDENGVTT